MQGDVEIIKDPVAGEVLDLTNGNNKNESVDEPAVPAVETETGVDGVEEPEGEVPTDKPDGEDGTVEDEATDNEESQDYFFGEEKVSVEVPEEIANALKDAGIDQKDVLSQLFKKGGDFSLDAETKVKLEDKFGKTLVDGYLNMYKNLNKQTLDAAAAADKEEAATIEKYATEYSAAVGGADGLEALEGYALKNLSDDQIAAYNAIMSSEDHNSQLFVIAQIKKQMELEDKLINGDNKVELIGDKEAGDNRQVTPLSKGYLSRAEYDTIMQSDEYWTDKAYQTRVDAARMAGFKHDKK